MNDRGNYGMWSIARIWKGYVACKLPGDPPWSYGRPLPVSQSTLSLRNVAHFDIILANPPSTTFKKTQIAVALLLALSIASTATADLLLRRPTELASFGCAQRDSFPGLDYAAHWAGESDTREFPSSSEERRDIITGISATVKTFGHTLWGGAAYYHRDDPGKKPHISWRFQGVQ